VLIENNRFPSSGSAILIAGDANAWYESGAVRDVTIRGHVFGESCRRVRVERNQLAEDVLGRNNVLEDTSDAELFIGPGQVWVR
jgi:hypothetical protein